MAWCKTFVDNATVALEACQNKVAELGDFPRELNSAFLSPGGTRDLKKRLGDDYLKALIKYSEAVGPAVFEANRHIAKAMSMMAAADQDSQQESPQEKKRGGRRPVG